MSISAILLSNLALIGMIIFALWCVSLWKRDASIVDIFWGLGFVFIAWFTVFNSEQVTIEGWVIAALVSVWGGRLAGYLFCRNSGKPEDYRYRAMRKKHGKRFPIVSLFTVFCLQGVIMWFVALPIQVGIPAQRSGAFLMILGSVLWGIGILFEAVGDYQMFRFKGDSANSGMVMDRGLWRYTRHPNYFGDFLVWWGFYFMSVEASSWWWTVWSPLLMSFLLMRVSGVPLLESSLRKRIAGYDEYVQATSSFFPLPRRKSNITSTA